MAVGFGIIATTRETTQEKMQSTFIQTSSMLSSLALDKCSAAVKKEAGATAYTPNESSSDHMTYVTLIWKNIGNVQTAECRYMIDKGIVLLRMDDRTVISPDDVLTGGSGGAAPKPVHH